MIEPLPFRTDADLPAAAAAVRAALRLHGVVALPTETFYGLAADPLDAAAVARTFALKRRPAERALLVVVSDLEAVDRIATIPQGWRERLAATWPAALTVVLPAVRPLPAAGSTVAVRVPDHALLRALLAEVGPLTATSANRSGEPPCTTAQEVIRAIPDGLAAVLDGGTTPGGAPSTLIDLCGAAPILLRVGAWTPPGGWGVKPR